MKNLSLHGLCAACLLAVAACSQPVTTDAGLDAPRDARDGAAGDATDAPADRTADVVDAGIDARVDVQTTDVSDVFDVLTTDTADGASDDVVDVVTVDEVDASIADVVDVVSIDAADVTPGTDAGDSSTGTDVVGVDRVVVPATGLVINEVDYDQIMGDSTEFIEIYNGGTAAVPLNNLALVLVNGAAAGGPAIYTTFGLAPGVSLMPGQYLVVGSATVTIPSSAVALRFAGANNNIQNGPTDALALIDTSTNTLIDALSYGGAVTGVTIAGFASPVSMVEGTMLPTTVVDSNTVVGSLSRTPNGNDSNDAANDWTFSTTPTPGVANVP